MRQFIPFAIPSGSPSTVQTQTKSAAITTNGGSVTVQPDSGYLLSSATVSANIPTQTKNATITTNGGSKTVTPDSGKLLTSVKVTANIPTEAKTQTITTNGSYTITPDSGKLMTKATISVNVPTGGGIPAPISAIETGSFISSSEANEEAAHVFSPTIRPDLILVYSSEVISASNTIVEAVISTYNGTTGAVKVKATSGTVAGSTCIVSSSGNNVTIKNSAASRWRTSLTYYYIIIQLDAKPTSAGDPPQSGTSEPGIML